MDERERPDYVELVRRRGLLEKEQVASYGGKFGTLTEVCWHRDCVTPMQRSSRNRTGPVVVGTHWVSVEAATRDREELAWYGGYDPRRSFNRVLDLALLRLRRRRRDIYVTQACLLLPRGSERAGVPRGIWEETYDRITRHEIAGRRVLAFGEVAEKLCEHGKEAYWPFRHPGTSNQSVEAQAAEVERALRWAMKRDAPTCREGW